MQQIGNKIKDNELPVVIQAGEASLEGNLGRPDGASGIVLFSHGSGSGRYSPRNREVAGVLQEAGIATLLLDLLTVEEEAEDSYTARLRFDIDLLTSRLILATDWVKQENETCGLKVGYFGASTGAAAALVAAAQRPGDVKAIVSRGGRPDLAASALPEVKAPTLLIVGGYDYTVLSLNQEAYRALRTEKEIIVIPKATHLFEETGALEEVAHFAVNWFVRFLGGSRNKKDEERS